MRAGNHIRILISFLSLLLLIACAPKQFRTGAKIDTTYNFDEVKTFAFVVVREKVAASANGKRLQQAIREALTVRGYLEVPVDSAKVQINYDIGIYSAAKFYRRDDQADGEGGLSIWVKDAKTGHTVWYGWSERVVKAGEDPDTVIRAAVRALFEERIPDAAK